MQKLNTNTITLYTRSGFFVYITSIERKIVHKYPVEAIVMEYSNKFIPNAEVYKMTGEYSDVNGHHMDIINTKGYK